MRRARRLAPAPPTTESEKPALATVEENLEKTARLEVAREWLLANCTREELRHEVCRRSSARGPRFEKHPKRGDGFLFAGSADEHREHLVEATGCSDLGVAERLLAEVATAVPGETAAIDRFNLCGAMLAGLAPRTPLEGILCSQMVAVHHLAMQLLARGGNPEGYVQHVESAVTSATKLLRTFTMQVEALGRLRGSGVTEQRVVVQHVTVADGGQAVIGAVSRASGGEGPE